MERDNVLANTNLVKLDEAVGKPEMEEQRNPKGELALQNLSAACFFYKAKLKLKGYGWERSVI